MGAKISKHTLTKDIKFQLFETVLNFISTIVKNLLEFEILQISKFTSGLRPNLWRVSGVNVNIIFKQSQ